MRMKSSTSDRFGKLTMSVADNANRLFDDAELLSSHRRYRTATSLAILSFEEFGKACVIHWVECGFLDNTHPKQISGHIDKQRLLLAYRAIQGVFKVARVSATPMPREISVDQIDPNFLRVVAESVREHTSVSNTIINSTVLNYAKNNGFYADLSDKLDEVSNPISCNIGWYHAARSFATEGREMLFSDDLFHRAMAATYLIFVGNKPVVAPKGKKLIEVIEKADKALSGQFIKKPFLRKLFDR